MSTCEKRVDRSNEPAEICHPTLQLLSAPWSFFSGFQISFSASLGPFLGLFWFLLTSLMASLSTIQA